MIILAIKTDQPESELELFDDHSPLAHVKYLAHRDLASTIHLKIAGLLKDHKLDWKDIQAVICFKGPGSFTGLRIGFSVANALAYGLTVPIVAAIGKGWQQKAIEKLLNQQNDEVVYPFYGSVPHITTPRK